MNEEESLWIRRFHRSPEANIQLFCLPHAGGSASYFFPMSRELAPAVQVLPVQYPGRQDRRFEPCVEDLQKLADLVFEAVKGLTDRPVALFGHSMGAALAFEVAVRMETKLGVSPAHLIVSGRRAPSTFRAEKVHLRDDDGIVAELRHLSGTADDMLGDTDILRMILPAIRADYRAIETYRGRPGDRVDAPITVLTGDSDPRMSLSDAHEWRSHTTGTSEVLVFPGGHFYLNDCRNNVHGVVARILAET
jgi:surfactin synthase thioesterase subunit